MKNTIIFFLIVILSVSFSNAQQESILIFTKTKGFRHQSIETGKRTISDLLTKRGINVDTTPDASVFEYETLKKYDALIFLNTTGDLFNHVQQEALKKYIRDGGGIVGIHAATDAEYDWPWFGKMMGGYFRSHPEQQTATVLVVDRSHPSTEMLPETWDRWDEWYDFKNMNPDIDVLAKLDESSYQGAKMGDNHPIVWCHEFEGGRVFYTGFGHTDETFKDELFQKHLLGGIQYVMGK